MTGRDRIVIIAVATLAILAAVWLLAVSPEREQASKLDAQVSAASAQLASAEGQVASARGAQSRYEAAYASVVSLGKAVPPSREVPALIYQLDQASNQKDVEFASITSGGGGFEPLGNISGRCGRGRLHRIAVHVCLQRNLSGPLPPLPAAQRLHRANLLGRAGQRAAADDSGCHPFTSNKHVRLGQGIEPRRAERHDHRDRVRAARRAGVDRRRDRHISHGRDRAGVIDFRSGELPDSSGDREGEPMSELFNSLKADLLDRRLLPIMALVAVALLAAVGYAALGGGGSSTATPTAAGSPSPQPSTKAGSIAVIPAATGAQQPVAETTDGVSHQHGGPSRNPFTPLPGATTASTSASAGNKSAAPSSPSTSASSTPSIPGKSSGGTSPAPTSPAKPAPTKPTPAKPQVAYQVDVLFGAGPLGTVPPTIQLTPLNDLTRLQPLTSAGGEAPLVFAGVAAAGKSAIFTLVREVILHGPAVCGPSASQCQTVRLSPGQTEELEYIVPGGQSLLYKLQLVSITAVKASAAKAASLFRSESKVGRALLRRDGLSALPGMRYAQDRGVVVIGGWSALAARAARARAARAHAARQR